jgi:hypothetical protein
MTYLTGRLDTWVLGRLSGTAVLATLPGGTATGRASIFNGTRPQAGGAPPTFLSFHQAGGVVSNCLPSGKDAVVAQYVTEAWQTGDDLSALTALLDAVEAQFQSATGYFSETTGGYRFSVLSQDAELQQVGVSQGVLYSSAGYRWLLAVEAA